MPAIITSVNGHPTLTNIKKFLCTSVDDVKKLPRVNIEGTLDTDLDPNINEPCSYESTATVANPFSGYMLAPNNEWVKIF